MHFHIEIEREEDGRWIAEVPDMPGVMVYGADRATAVARVQALALRVHALELSDELREELDGRLEEQAANSGVGRPWSEVKARLLGPE